MRELNLQEAALVGGGNDDDGLEDARPGQPDDSYITVTYQLPGSTVTLTAKCVDYLRGLDTEGPGSESGL